MKLFKLLPTIAATVLAASLTVIANAAPITGDIQFLGSGVFDLSTTNDSVDTLNVAFMMVGAEPTGDFAPYTSVFSFVNIQNNPWDFNSAGEIGLWNVGGFTFTLQSVVVNTYSAAAGADVQILGTLSGNGFDVTDGQFNISAQPNAANENVTVVFSADSANVPAPSAAALLSLGLAGLALGRRRAARK